MKHLPYVFALLLLAACAGESEKTTDDTLSFLEGRWQRQGMEVYEEWQADGNGGLKGRGFKMVDGQEQTTETLAITQVEGQWVYQATVPSQNNGATISFPLNPQESGWLSFENPNHDYPQKIQYRKESADSVAVQLQGAGRLPFTYLQLKQ